jgi:hypothetical protein
MEIHGQLLKLMESYGDEWTTMEINGNHWKTVEMRKKNLADSYAMGNQWTTMTNIVAALCQPTPPDKRHRRML